MTAHKFVLDDVVVEFFTDRTKKRAGAVAANFSSVAEDPYQKGEWIQRTAAGRVLQVKHSGRWLLRYWLDDPVLEIRVVDIEELIP